MLPDDFTLPRAYNATGGFAWQINSTTAFTADYVHGYGTDQLGATDRNLPASGAITAANPRPVANFSRVTMVENFSNSWYNALETQLRTRVRGANNLQVSYTLSKSWLDGVDFYSTVRGTQRTPQEAGYNTTDTRHNLTASASTDLPWNFQLSGILKLVSGFPIGRISAGVDLDGDGNTSGDRPVGLPPRSDAATSTPSSRSSTRSARRADSSRLTASLLEAEHDAHLRRPPDARHRARRLAAARAVSRDVQRPEFRRSDRRQQHHERGAVPGPDGGERSAAAAVGRSLRVLIDQRPTVFTCLDQGIGVLDRQHVRHLAARWRCCSSRRRRPGAPQPALKWNEDQIKQAVAPSRVGAG